MTEFTQEIISALQYLLPGFLSAWIFYGLTSHPLPSQFERIVQALILTLIIQLLFSFEKFLSGFLPSPVQQAFQTGKSNVAVNAANAILIGLIFTWSANKDVFHSLVRKVGITSETSYPSEWFGAFLKNITYVVLHLHDERRIYGWPIEWPSEPGKGHFLLEKVSWLDGETEIQMVGVRSVLINATDVKWVEFMDMKQEKADGEKRTESTTSTSQQQ